MICSRLLVEKTVQESFEMLVVIPCHNEAGRVAKVVADVRRVLPRAEVVVVDDGSSDDTVAEARGAGARVIRHLVNLGYGASLETGYRYAQLAGHRQVLQLDGDGQHLAEELPVVLAPLLEDRADLVIGSRFLAGDGHAATSWVRRLGQRLFALCIYLLSGKRFTDPTSGFQALGPRGLRLLATNTMPSDYPDADILLITHLAGLRVIEVPVRMKARVDGRSMHSGIAAVYYVMKMFLSMFIVLLNRRQWQRG